MTKFGRTRQAPKTPSITCGDKLCRIPYQLSLNSAEFPLRVAEFFDNLKNGIYVNLSSKAGIRVAAADGGLVSGGSADSDEAIGSDSIKNLNYY